MLESDDCRKKAAQSLLDADTVTDPSASAALRRLSERWTALTQEIERDRPLRSLSPSLTTRPVDVLRRTTRPADVIGAADVLRQRLRLTDSEDTLFDSDLFD